MLIAWTGQYRCPWRMPDGAIPLYDTDTLSCYEGTTRKVLSLLREGKRIENCRNTQGSILEVDIITPKFNIYTRDIFVDVKSDDLYYIFTYIIQGNYYYIERVCKTIVYGVRNDYLVVVPPVVDGDNIYCPVYRYKDKCMKFIRNADVSDTNIFTYENGYLQRYMREILLK